METSVEVSRVSDATAEPAPVTKWWVRVDRAVRSNPYILASVILLLVMLALALLAPVLSPYPPTKMHFGAQLTGPSLSHPFGVDRLGRDVFTRTMVGMRLSIAVAFASVGLAMAIGLPLGLLAGFYGRITDNLIMRPLDILMAFPLVLLAIAFLSVFGEGLGVLVVSIGIVYVPILARVLRASVLALKRELFVEGARARGASDRRLLLRHILPNCLGPLMVQATILMGFAIIIEAALSFVGIGIQPPTPSLGLMLADGRSFLREAPWLEVFPGTSIAIIVLGFNLLSDGISHASNPPRE